MTINNERTRTTGNQGVDLSPLERARRQVVQDKVAAVLAAPLVAESLTTTARFELPTPVDLPFDLPDDPKFRLKAIEVSATRYLGAPSDDPDIAPLDRPVLDVRGLAVDLKADGTPRADRYEHWVLLPSELAEPLLGKALTS